MNSSSQSRGGAHSRSRSTGNPDAAPEDQPTRSLASLLRELPGILLDLARAEFEQFKREMLRKLKKISVATLLLITALTMVTFFVGLLLLAAVYGLALVMPVWAAALTVAGVLFLLIIVLIVVALSLFRGNAPIPTETFDSLVEDAYALKGEGPYDFD